MATTMNNHHHHHHHCSSFSLMIIKLMLMLLLLIFGADAHDHQHLQPTTSHYHTLEINTLFPASVCTAATTHIQGSNKRQSTLEVLHRHGPCSQLGQDQDHATTTIPSLSEVLSHDQSRVDSIQARVKPNSDTNKIKNINSNSNRLKDKKANLPVQSGRSLGSGNYIVTIGLGTPTKTLSLIFDTGTTEVFPNFLFGCGQNNQGLFGNTAGLLGLGRNSLSIISQTAQKYGKYFSYCLPSTSSSTGHLTLSKSGVSTNVKFTPFASSQGTSFYFIDILSISVGGRQLPISQSVFTTAGSIIDSGTVITRLPPAAYSTMSAAFRKLMAKYKTAPAYSILDTCYDFTGLTTVSIPAISFTFGGNVKVDLAPSGILVAISTSRICLAFAGNNNADDVAIFGNTQQKTLGGV
ncbi:Aspartyl protease family protein [Sesamum angolense]|uniref:Aspartyl protease family protein n=1 Tax=Sesamum angolense TaxID=2727404 RepID=A0AAE2BX79_9LAMI|nr:Aspartyl protease family protein [Sesamum angolense]